MDLFHRIIGVMSDQKDVVLRISSNKDPGYVKRVAGAMTWQLRDHGFCKARAVKVDAVSTATKAVAIVNQRVSQAGLNFAMDLFLSPAESESGTNSTAIEMVVHDADCTRPGEFVVYKVSGKRTGDKTLVTRLAGAIATPVRRGDGVSMRCIGPSAVYRAVMASCVAKGYIYTNGLDAIIVPTWQSIPSDDKPVSLIQLDFWGKKISA